jgi:hypothetical protein
MVSICSRSPKMQLQLLVELVSVRRVAVLDQKSEAANELGGSDRSHA